MQRVPEAATAFGDRSAPYMLSLDAIWSRPADDAANIEWARSAWTDMRRYGNGRMYLNFPGHGEGEDLVRSALGANVYARLAKIKRVYDPSNLFRMNHNITPEQRSEIARKAGQAGGRGRKKPPPLRSSAPGPCACRWASWRRTLGQRSSVPL